jgi:hypothetical protein
VLTLTASGVVSDYSDTSSLQQLIATAAGVDKSLVTISVAAASVIITAAIAVPAATTAAAVTSSLSASLSTTEAASDVLGITVVCRRIWPASSPPAPPPPSPPPAPPPTPPPTPPPPSPPPLCSDTDNGVLDSLGNGCSYYATSPSFCDMAEYYDTDGFKSATMCCVCGGGSPEVYTVVLSDTVTATMTAAGSVSDFDQAALEQNFATAFGVPTSQITISIAAPYGSHDGRRLSGTSYSSGTATLPLPLPLTLTLTLILILTLALTLALALTLTLTLNLVLFRHGQLHVPRLVRPEV